MKLPEDPRVREAVGIAMKALVRRSRLSSEIAAKLRARGFSEDEIAGAVDCLESQGLLSDEQAIRDLVEARSGKRAVGAKWLQDELARRGVSETQMASIVFRTHEEELEAMQRALAGRQWRRGDRAKAGRFLASRGFDSDSIGGAIERFFGAAE